MLSHPLFNTNMALLHGLRKTQQADRQILQNSLNVSVSKTTGNMVILLTHSLRSG